MTIRDIHPKSPIEWLRPGRYKRDLDRPIDTGLAAAVVGMSFNFAVRAAGYASGSRPRTLTLKQVLDLLELDGYQETFVPRSEVPKYLLRVASGEAPKPAEMTPIVVPSDWESPTLVTGHAGDLLRSLAPASVQCVVTSSPYWGMRVYDNARNMHWADGERCPYGFEQTPEGFIRHTVELLYLMKPALTPSASVWWNLMDTYNTRTPIRGNSRDKLRAMGGDPDYALGWTEHEACRHSAGHMYLDDGELALIPSRVAERASRIGYRVKSVVTWNKYSTPEPVKSRVTRQSEVILHLAAGTDTYFDKAGWQNLKEARLGAVNERYESPQRLTDVWQIPVSTGANGHGAEFPRAVPGRCIALTSRPGDLVLDPFIGSGTTALAAIELRRRCIGFDISGRYIEIARRRTRELASQCASVLPLDEPTHVNRHVNGKPSLLDLTVSPTRLHKGRPAKR